MFRRCTAVLLLVSLPTVVRAEELPVDNSGDPRATPAFDDTHPIYAGDSHWAAELVAAIAGLLLAAAIIGPIVRAEAPGAVPPAVSHEEDPAADRH